MTVTEMYTVLELFMLMWMLQKPTQKSYYDKDHLLCIPFFPAEYTTIRQLKNNTERHSEGKRWSTDREDTPLGGKWWDQ